MGKVWEAGAQDGIPEQLSPLLSCQSLSPDPENEAPGEPGPSCYFLITNCFYKAFQLHTTVVLLEILQGKLPHVEGKEVG